MSEVSVMNIYIYIYIYIYKDRLRKEGCERKQNFFEEKKEKRRQYYK